VRDVRALAQVRVADFEFVIVRRRHVPSAARLRDLKLLTLLISKLQPLL
jgi:hypothetical protein